MNLLRLTYRSRAPRRTTQAFIRQPNGSNADSGRASHSGAAKPAIAGRILGEILLMVVLREIERTRRRDLGGDCGESLCRQRSLIGPLRTFRGVVLRGVESVDR